MAVQIQRQALILHQPERQGAGEADIGVQGDPVRRRRRISAQGRRQRARAGDVALARVGQRGEGQRAARRVGEAHAGRAAEVLQEYVPVLACEVQVDRAAAGIVIIHVVVVVDPANGVELEGQAGHALRLDAFPTPDADDAHGRGDRRYVDGFIGINEDIRCVGKHAAASHDSATRVQRERPVMGVEVARRKDLSRRLSPDPGGIDIESLRAAALRKLDRIAGEGHIAAGPGRLVPQVHVLLQGDVPAGDHQIAVHGEARAGHHHDAVRPGEGHRAAGVDAVSIVVGTDVDFLRAYAQIAAGGQDAVPHDRDISRLFVDHEVAIRPDARIPQISAVHREDHIRGMVDHRIIHIQSRQFHPQRFILSSTNQGEVLQIALTGEADPVCAGGDRRAVRAQPGGQDVHHATGGNVVQRHAVPLAVRLRQNVDVLRPGHGERAGLDRKALVRAADAAVGFQADQAAGFHAAAQVVCRDDADRVPGGDDIHDARGMGVQHQRLIGGPPLPPGVFVVFTGYIEAQVQVSVPVKIVRRSIGSVVITRADAQPLVRRANVQRGFQIDRAPVEGVDLLAQDAAVIRSQLQVVPEGSQRSKAQVAFGEFDDGVASDDAIFQRPHLSARPDNAVSVELIDAAQLQAVADVDIGLEARAGAFILDVVDPGVFSVQREAGRIAGLAIIRGKRVNDHVAFGVQLEIAVVHWPYGLDLRLAAQTHIHVISLGQQAFDPDPARGGFHVQGGFVAILPEVIAAAARIPVQGDVVPRPDRQAAGGHFQAAQGDAAHGRVQRCVAGNRREVRKIDSLIARDAAQDGQCAAAGDRAAGDRANIGRIAVDSDIARRGDAVIGIAAPDVAVALDVAVDIHVPARVDGDIHVGIADMAQVHIAARLDVEELVQLLHVAEGHVAAGGQDQGIPGAVGIDAAAGDRIQDEAATRD